MAKKTQEYYKLPGTKKGFLIGKYSLWQGTDHLLHIYSRFGVEDYKRFYFNDIQAVITHKTAVGKVKNIILGCFCLLLTLPAILFEGGWALFYATACAVALIIFVINVYKGPTCETRLLTAVQTEKLHSLHRLNSTLKVMERLRPLIQHTQGTLTQEDLNKLPARRIDKKSSSGQMQTAEPAKITDKHEKGRAHMVLFALLLFDGVLVTLGFFFTHVALTILSSIAVLCMGISVIIALVKQHNSKMPVSLQAITWASLGFACITFVTGYAISVVFAFKNPDIAYNQWEILRSMSALAPRENPLKLSFDIFTLCGALFLGIPGLFVLITSEKKGKK